MNHCLRQPIQGWTLPGFSKSTLQEIMEYAVSVQFGNAAPWILQLFNYNSHKDKTEFDAWASYNKCNCPWVRINKDVQANTNIRDILHDWQWNDKIGNKFLTKEEREEVYPCKQTIFKKCVPEKTMQYIITRTWEVCDECWTTPHWTDKADDPVSWNDLRQGTPDNNDAKFKELTIECLEYLITNQESYRTYCMCNKAPVNPLSEPSQCCDVCGHPQRLTCT